MRYLLSLKHLTEQKGWFYKKRHRNNNFMKQILLTVTLGLAAVATANAQYVNKSFQNTEFHDAVYGETFTPAGVFNHVSANGAFAVGADQSQITSNYGGAFLWRKSNPDKLEQLNTEHDRITANDVSNDGIIVGSFEKRADPDEEDVAYPGYKPVDGEWVKLPVPDSFSVAYAKSQDFAEEARAITPDGAVIAGNIDYRVGWTYNTVFGRSEKVVTAVTLWKKAADGSYCLDTCYTELGKAGQSLIYDNGELKTVDHEVSYYSFLVYDISNDGKTVVGMNVAGSGGFNPAFVRDGKLVQLFDCGEEASYEDYDDESGEDESEVNFNGGVIQSIDANGNMYGYYVTAEDENTYFIYTADGKLEYTDNLYSCATKDGVKYNPSSNGLNPLWDCSEDGTVLVGGGVGSMGFGAYNYPALAYIDDASSSIDRVQSVRSNVGVKLTASGALFVTGEYGKAAVYNAAGAVVAEGGQGKAFNMAGKASGTYIVKVDTANGTKTFKVAK